MPMTLANNSLAAKIVNRISIRKTAALNATDCNGCDHGYAAINDLLVAGKISVTTESVYHVLVNIVLL